MIGFLNSMQLTGKGAEGLIKRVIALIAAIDAIPKETDILIKIQTQYTSRTDYIATQGNDPDSRQVANDAFGSAGAAAKQTISNLNKQIQSLLNQLKNIGSGGTSFLGSAGSKSGGGGGGGGSTASGPDVSELDLPTEIANATNRTELIQEAIRRARALQHLIPGADKEASNDIVELLKGTQRILEVRGVKDDYLRKALEELADVEKKRLEFDAKADTIRRIRVGSGSFAALANVPLNTQTGVSVGSPNGPITVNLNINGQVLTPAQFANLADQIAAAIKRQIAGG
jgi:hypothetical protein